MNFLNLLVSALSGGLFTGVPIFLLTRKKYKVEVKGTELDQVEKAATIWRTLSEELEKRFKEDIRELRQENEAVQNRLTSILEENNKLKEQMYSLEKQLREAKCQNTKLLEELKKFNKNYVPA